MELIIKSIHITAQDAGNGRFDPKNGNTDVIISLEDGTKPLASFFSYENINSLRRQHQFNGDFSNGSYFWNKNMILVEECSLQTIESVVNDIIEEGNFPEAFRQLPGVHIQEVPSGVRTIMGVSTSVALFIGRTKWGPVNEPFLCLSYLDFERTFTSDNSLGDMARAVRLFFLNGGTHCYILRIATLTDPTPANNAAKAQVTLDYSSTNDSLVIQARHSGVLGNSIRAVVDCGTLEDATTFNLKLFRVVTDPFGAKTETDVQKWTGLSKDPNNPRFVEKYVDYQWASVALATSAINRPAENTGRPMAHAILTGGQDGIAPLSKDYDNAYLLIDNEVDIFNLMILPKDIGCDDSFMIGLWQNASAFCLTRRAFLLLDPPAATWTTVQASITGVDSLRNGVVKDHCAVFYPPVTINENGSEIHVGPSGAIAGLIARIDANRGVWKAPAGVEADLRGINGLKYRFSDNENSALNLHGINTFRFFTGSIVTWAARTMDGDGDLQSEYKYINVRRLALFLEESLYRGLKWAVFERNDEPLWAQIRLNAGVFMHDLFIQGAFQGTTPKDAYFIKCDKETTTQTDIDKGVVNTWVGFAPLKPAEFVILHIQQMAGEINV
jgi:hypothetical protein